jgi:hypothetical protein
MDGAVPELHAAAANFWSPKPDELLECASLLHTYADRWVSSQKFEAV